MEYLDQINDSNSFFEKSGDFFTAPGRLFFGSTYTLEEGVLKHRETFFSPLRAVARVAAIALLPLVLISTLFGMALKGIAYSMDPALKARFSLPVLENARTEDNFAGTLPQSPWFPNCVNSQSKSLWGSLYNADPIRVPDGMENPMEAMKHLLSDLAIPNFNSQNAVLTEERPNYLHYEYTVVIPTGVLKGTYIDDIDLCYDRDGQCIQIRSASRTGFRDAVHLDFSQMGANKKRVEAIRQAFEDPFNP